MDVAELAMMLGGCAPSPPSSPSVLTKPIVMRREHVCRASIRLRVQGRGGQPIEHTRHVGRGGMAVYCWTLLSLTQFRQKLQFYGLYKQATIGDVNTSRPSFFDFVGQKKWYFDLLSLCAAVADNLDLCNVGTAGSLTAGSLRRAPPWRMYT